MKQGSKVKIEPAQLSVSFNELRKKNEEAKKDKFDPIENKDKTRSLIAKIFVCSYFVGLGLVFLITLAYNLIIAMNKLNIPLLEVKDIILTVTGSIGTSLGFVVGYYFKGQEK